MKAELSILMDKLDLLQGRSMRASHSLALLIKVLGEVEFPEHVQRVCENAVTIGPGPVLPSRLTEELDELIAWANSSRSWIENFDKKYKKEYKAKI